MMKYLLICAFSLTGGQALAEDKDDGFNLVEEGAQLILRGLMQEMEPAIGDIQNMMDEIGPALDQFALELGPVVGELMNRVDDFRHYEQPEFLPNGDIIIRRRPDAPEFETTEPEASIDL